MTKEILAQRILDLLEDSEITTAQKLQIIATAKARLTEIKKAEIQEAINEDLENIRRQQGDLSDICYTC